MIDFSWCVEFSFLFSELVLGAVGLFLIASVHDLEKWLKRFYLGVIILMMLVALLDLILKADELNGGTVWLERYEYVFRSLLYLPLFPAFTAYLLSCTGEKLRGNRMLYLVCALRLLLLAEAVIDAAFGITEGLTAANWEQYIPALAVILLLGAASMITETVILVTRWKKLTGRQRFFFIVCYFALQFWMLLLLEMLILRDQSKRYQQQKEELLRRKTQVAVLQMRPHFIYNTLINIYYLCQDDAAKAQQVILDFSRYLQANFTAVASEECIPFTKELEHTKAYLAVVKARYEDRLYVEYDTPVFMFHLPALTLQPIVENAVKYGMSPGLDPLYISIATQADEHGVRIIVEDTGPGYHPKDDGEPHTALKNIRERLKIMCHGTLEITQREAGGTRVTIVLPLKK